MFVSDVVLCCVVLCEMLRCVKYGGEVLCGVECCVVWSMKVRYCVV
jgi:hypothetical protein